MDINPAALGAALKGDFVNALIAATPGGIERQEKHGQMVLVVNDELPKTIHGATREQLEAIGFKFGDDADDIFVKCQLPKGWKKKATDHAMHSDLLDANGCVRAGVFYKAAFYDRKADMSMQRRYTVAPFHPSIKGEDWSKVVVKDNVTNKVIEYLGEWSRGLAGGYALSNDLEKKAQAWLDQKYPQHRDAMAYWD